MASPTQPLDGERVPGGSWQAELLPSFDGTPADLPMNRTPPLRFEAVG